MSIVFIPTVSGVIMRADPPIQFPPKHRLLPVTNRPVTGRRKIKPTTTPAPKDNE